MNFQHIFIRKYLLFLFFICVVGSGSISLCDGYVNVPEKAKKILGTPFDVVSLYGIELLPQGYDVQHSPQGWSVTVWQVATHPLIMPLIFMAMRPVTSVIENTATDLYRDYWLTDEQKQEIVTQREQEKQERRQQVELQSTEIRIRRDPRWKEAVIALQQQEVEQGKQALTVGQHQLAENNLILAQALRESEEQEHAHFKRLMRDASPEMRNELQKQFDEYCLACMKKRTESVLP